MALDIEEDLGTAHMKQAVIGALRADTELTEAIGGAEHIFPAKRARQRDDDIAILVERVNTSSTWVGNHYRTFHVMQAKLVMTRPAMEARDPLFPDVVVDRINEVMTTAFPDGTVPRGRDDAGGMDVPGEDETARIQWPQRFRVLAFTAN